MRVESRGGATAPTPLAPLLPAIAPLLCGGVAWPCCSGAMRVVACTPSPCCDGGAAKSGIGIGTGNGSTGLTTGSSWDQDSELRRVDLRRRRCILQGGEKTRLGGGQCRPQGPLAGPPPPFPTDGPRSSPPPVPVTEGSRPSGALRCPCRGPLPAGCWQLAPLGSRGTRQRSPAPRSTAAAPQPLLLLLLPLLLRLLPLLHLLPLLLHLFLHLLLLSLLTPPCCSWFPCGLFNPPLLLLPLLL
jgi:hypothetical protein